MRNIKYFLLILITFLLTICLNAETYTEDFDVNANWSGGSGYTTRSYTNSLAPGGLTFISNDVYREGSDTYSGSYAWRLDDESGAYLNAEMSLTVQSFSIQMARWDNNPSPNISIEYSTDGGSNYSQIGTIDGSYFTGGDKVYRAYEHTFASPITPDAGSTIVIRFYTTSGERMFYDDFSVVYSTGANLAPTISNIIQAPDTDIYSSTTVLVSADVTDDSGVSSVVLNWGTASGTLPNSITMAFDSGSTYIANSEIPAQANNTTVYYQITATDDADESSTTDELSYLVQNPIPPTAEFSANTTTVYLGNPVTFTNESTDGLAPLTFSWNFGDSNTSTDENPSHTYASTGTYTVELTVTDANSASDTETKTGYITVEDAPAGASDLFISEYIEGSSNNKAIEIFNGTGQNVDLSDYTLKKGTNGADYSVTYNLSDAISVLGNNEVVVIANSSSDALILAESDASAGIMTHNGDDGIGLFKNGVLIDVIGTTGQGDPGNGWSVAGVSDATANHTLVRKASVFAPTTDWSLSAGTSAEDSQWIVETQDDFSFLGSHTFDGVAASNLVVDFSADVTSGDQPLTVTFTNLVSGGTSPYLFSWDFDEDGLEDSSAENPVHTFTEAGVYSISLRVLDSDTGDSTHVKTDYITVNSTSIESYYSSITETSGQALKSQLYTLIATNTLSDYDASREAMYSSIDNVNNSVTGVYSGFEVAHNYGNTSSPAGIDCEHSYPQSWLEEYETPTDYAIARTDIHHLFPTKSEVNSSRGNLPFDNVNSVLNSWTEASGYVSYRGYNIDGETVFEVADQHKGNTARAMFYMNTRWNLPLSDDGSTTGLNIDMLPTLLQWHESDPVDQAEIDRNEGIYAYQGNRNPFVNHPEWVTAIYGSASNPQVATPVISPASGSFVNSLEVTISCLTNGASIYYTSDNSTPTTSSTLYENPFTITETSIIKAIAVKADFDDSEIASASYTLTEDQTATSELFISEYIEGASGDNKALEIFNGTGSNVDLSAYSVKLAYNGGDWNNSVITLSGTLANNSVYTIGKDNGNNDAEILAADLLTGSLSFNGDDTVGLFKNNELIDIIGVYQSDPGSGWDVAGTSTATADHVLVRKAHIIQGNPDYWTLENGFGSAGTDVNDSEWIVYSNAYYTDFGSHNYAPLTVDFSADLTSTTAGTTIQFTANVSGGSSPYAYEWDFNNDGVADSMSANPNHIYNVAGTYSVSLYVVDNNLDERTLVKTDYITVASNIVYADDLIISEYVAGSGNNKSLEVYNGTGQTVDLSNYSIRISNPGGSWAQTLNLSGNLENDAVYVVAHPSANASVLNSASTTNANLAFNGKNAIGLFKSDTALDIIGVPNASPAGNADGWTVANVANATASRTLVRKSNVSAGNTNSETWTASGNKNGTTTPDSEWTVFEQDSFGDLGSHDFDFGDETLPVTLTSFTSSMTYSGLGQPMVSIQWITEAESGLIGYNILRSSTPFLDNAIRANEEIVSANNSLVGNNYSYTDQNVDLHSNYYYWLESVELSNENQTFGPIHIKVVGHNSDSVTVPHKTSLRSIYPNPFNPSTTVRFYVNTTDRVNIKVYNIRGQEIKQLTQEIYQPGFYKVNWNGRDENDNRCASGIYFFKMETTRESQLIKGILVK